MNISFPKDFLQVTSGFERYPNAWTCNLDISKSALADQDLLIQYGTVFYHSKLYVKFFSHEDALAKVEACYGYKRLVKSIHNFVLTLHIWFAGRGTTWLSFGLHLCQRVERWRWSYDSEEESSLIRSVRLSKNFNSWTHGNLCISWICISPWNREYKHTAFSHFSVS